MRPDQPPTCHFSADFQKLCTRAWSTEPIGWSLLGGFKLSGFIRNAWKRCAGSIHQSSPEATVAVSPHCLPEGGQDFSSYSDLSGRHPWPMCPTRGRSGAPEGLAGASRWCLCLSHHWGVLARACVCACPMCACFCLQAQQGAPPRNMSPPGCACVTSLNPQGQSVYLLRASPLPSLAETRGPPAGVGASPSPG